MLLRSQFRWSTLRVMVFTSMVWVIFGMCILVYYMDCLNGKAGCRNKDYNTNLVAESGEVAQQQASNLENSHALRQAAAIAETDFGEENWPYLRLPAYQEHQLHSWKPAGKCFLSLELVSPFCWFSSPLKPTLLAWREWKWCEAYERGRGSQGRKVQVESIQHNRQRSYGAQSICARCPNWRVSPALTLRHFL